MSIKRQIRALCDAAEEAVDEGGGDQELRELAYALGELQCYVEYALTAQMRKRAGKVNAAKSWSAKGAERLGEARKYGG